MLRGVDGLIFHRDPNTLLLAVSLEFFLSDFCYFLTRMVQVNHKIIVSHLTPLILFQQLQTFAKFGNHANYISTLCDSHFGDRDAVLQALCAALRDYLEKFRSEITALATRVDAGLTLLELESVLAPKRRDVENVSQVLRKLAMTHTTTVSAGQVIGTLYDYACEFSLLGDARGLGLLLLLKKNLYLVLMIW